MARRAKKASARQTKRRARTRSGDSKRTTAPPRHPRLKGNESSYIAPVVYMLRAKLLRGTLRVQRRLARSAAAWKDGTVPPQLEAFVRTPSIESLCIVLRRHPGLYWHPLVRRQVGYLQQTRSNPLLWEHLGWQVDADTPPRETLEARSKMEQLISAHAEGLVAGRRIRFDRKPLKRGPRAGLPNPSPASAGYEFVSAAELSLDQEALHHFLDKPEHGLRAIDREDESALKRLGPIVHAALDAAGPSWSSKQEGYFDRPIPKTLATMSVSRRTGWYIAHLATRWNIDINRLVDRWYPDHRLWQRAYSVATELSYAILAELLEVTPYAVFTRVDQYRRSP